MNKPKKRNTHVVVDEHIGGSSDFRGHDDETSSTKEQVKLKFERSKISNEKRVKGHLII